MGKIIRNGIEFSGTTDTANNINYDNSISSLVATTAQEAIDELDEKIGNGGNIVYLRQAEYDALPDTKYTDNVEYRIIDAGVRGSAENVSYDNSKSGLAAKNVQGAVDELIDILAPQLVSINDSDLFDTDRYEEANGGYFKIGKLVIVELRVKVKSDISSSGLTNVTKPGVFPRHSKPNGSSSLSCYTTTGLSLGTYLAVDGTIGFYGQSGNTITAGSFIVIGGKYVEN